MIRPELAGLAALALLETAAMAATPLTGRWGGDRVNLVLAEAGGRFAADCASGSIDGPVTLDAANRFSAAGRHAADGPGPQRLGAIPAAARYDGRLEGNILALTVSSADAPPRTYRLIRDRQVKLIRCL